MRHLLWLIYAGLAATVIIVLRAVFRDQIEAYKLKREATKHPFDINPIWLQVLPRGDARFHDPMV